MAAPADPFDQPLIQETPALGMNIGSVNSGRFVTWGYDETLADDAFILWRITNDAVIRTKAVATSGLYVNDSAENDAGVVAFRGSSGAANVAARLNADLTYTLFTIPDNVEQMWVSGDGAEIVFRAWEYNETNFGDDVHLYGYSLSGVLQWDFVIDTSTNLGLGHRSSGFVAGAPRAGRVVWVNTTATIMYVGVDSGLGSSATGTVPALPFPVISASVRFNVTWDGRSEYGGGYPNASGTPQIGYINGVACQAPNGSPGNLNAHWSTAVFYVISWCSLTVTLPDEGDPFSYIFDGVTPYTGDDGYQWTNSVFYYYYQYGAWDLSAELDMSEMGGDTIELRNGSGSVLDRIATPAEFLVASYSTWVGTGSNTLTGFPVNGGSGGGG